MLEGQLCKITGCARILSSVDGTRLKERPGFLDRDPSLHFPREVGEIRYFQFLKGWLIRVLA